MSDPMTSPEWPDLSDAEVERRKVMRDIPGRVIRAHEMGPGFCSCGAGIGDSIDVRWHLVNQAVAATFDHLTAARSVSVTPSALDALAAEAATHEQRNAGREDTYGNEIERVGCMCGSGWECDANADPDEIDREFQTHVRSALAGVLDTAARSVLPEPDAVGVREQIRRAIKAAGDQHYAAAVEDHSRQAALFVRQAFDAAAIIALTYDEHEDLARTAPPTEPAEVGRRLASGLSRTAQVMAYGRVIDAEPAEVGGGRRSLELMATERDAARDQRDAATDELLALRADLADRDKTIADVRGLIDPEAEMAIVLNGKRWFEEHDLRAILDGTAGAGEVDGR